MINSQWPFGVILFESIFFDLKLRTLNPNSELIPTLTLPPLWGREGRGGLADFFDLGDDLFGLEVSQTDGT
jgi:hypothetical protein